MSIAQALLPEFDHEMATTRRVLERVPDDKLTWKPHERSMALGRLAGHTAELGGLIPSAMTTESLDMATVGMKPLDPASRQELLGIFDGIVAKARESIASAKDEDLMKTWTLLVNGKTIFSMPRAGIVRTIFLNHVIHHRGQLSVYLRMAGAPVPSIYGPSADEGNM